MDLSDFTAKKMEAAMADLEEQLHRQNRVAIGNARWEPDESGALHLTVDSVPISTVTLLGRERVYELYQQALREIGRD